MYISASRWQVKGNTVRLIQNYTGSLWETELKNITLKHLKHDPSVRWIEVNWEDCKLLKV